MKLVSRILIILISIYFIYKHVTSLSTILFQPSYLFTHMHVIFFLILVILLIIHYKPSIFYYFGMILGISSIVIRSLTLNKLHASIEIIHTQSIYFIQKESIYQYFKIMHHFHQLTLKERQIILIPNLFLMFGILYLLCFRLKHYLLLNLIGISITLLAILKFVLMIYEQYVIISLPEIHKLSYLYLIGLLMTLLYEILKISGHLNVLTNTLLRLFHHLKQLYGMIKERFIAGGK